MINLIVTVFGGLLLILGFYGMSFGFATPPELGIFFGGLCSSVFGVMIMVFFGSRVNLPRSSSKQRTKIPKQVPKPVKGMNRKGALENIGKNIKPPAKPVKPSPKIKPQPKPVSVEKSKPSTTDIKEPQKPAKKITPVTTRPIPKKVNKQSNEDLSEHEKELKTSTPPEFSKVEPKKVAPISKGLESDVEPKKVASISKGLESDVEPKKVAPSKVSRDDTSPIKPVLLKESASEKSDKRDSVKPVPKHIDASKLKSSKNKEKDESEFVKKRLNRLKENYIKNAKDIESIIDERLDSFKGTLDTLKSESQEPSIIWSFDAGDVQDALKDTISKADKKILMMYPWIRNVDVAILKKFMDTESRMIIQEASLDDDTSVELIKLLLENNVKIRTMPHIHTVAVVSDNTNGLIISTDPIYESFEVGVMYKDQKSIEEIERLFEDAWGISKDVDMEIKK